MLTLRGAGLVADGALPLVGEVDDVGVPDPGAVVLEDLITVLALQAQHLVLVRDPDVLPQRPLVAATLPAVLAEVALTWKKVIILRNLHFFTNLCKLSSMS